MRCVTRNLLHGTQRTVNRKNQALVASGAIAATERLCDTPGMAATRRKTFLLEWREHRGLSQEVVAAALSMNKSTLSRMERGLTPYSQDRLEALAALYGCDPAELLIQHPREETNIVKIWDRASRDQRRAIGTVAETMIGYGREDAEPTRRRG